MAPRTDRSHDLDLALRSAREAGRLVMRTFRSDPEVHHKSPDQPVTEADLRADALLKERLLGSRPVYGWLSEETVDRPERLSRRLVWVIDPIDGTRSFIAGYAEFGISIGLVDGGRPVVGVIHNPAQDETFWAMEGEGAFLQHGDAPAERLRMREPPASRRPALLASRTEIGRGEFDAFEAGHEIVELGSTAYKMAGVAAGRGDAFLSRGPKSEWDVAAGVLIIEEAGGMATDLTGRRVAFNRPDPRIPGILVAPRGLHRALLEQVRNLMPPDRHDVDGREGGQR